MTTKTGSRKHRTTASGKKSRPRSAYAGSQGQSKTTLQTRMTEEQKRVIQEAAENRQIAVSEYVRLTVFEQAKRELEAAAENVYCLTADEQAALWQALHAPVKLTAAQKRLSRLMRGEE